MPISPKFTTPRARGGISVLAYAFSLAVNFFTSRHPYVGIGFILLAVVWNIYLFWPEIKLLKITHPKGSQLESPGWLYLFGVVALGMVVIATFLFYQAAEGKPESPTSEEFAQPYIHGKHLRIADFADANNLIEGRTFEDCFIYGPAVLYGADYTDVGYSVFDSSPQELFLQVVPNSSVAGPHAGVIILKDCKFRRCHFSHITFAATPDIIEKWKRESPQNEKK